MRGLAYLEWCYARNNFNAIRRSPARLILWTLYVVSLVFLSVGRFAHGGAQRSTGLGVSHGAAIGIAGGFFVLTGLSILLGAAGRFAAFRSSAEAVLMSNAGIRPLTIAIWLQLRKSVAGFRSLGAFSYTFLIFAPVHAGFFGTARAFLATIVVLAIPQTAALPAFLLARGRGKVPVMIVGALFAAAGLIYALAGLSGAHVFDPLLRATHLDPALLVKAALLAQPVAFVVPSLLLACFVGIVAMRGNDAIPEIYAASNTMLERQRGRFGRREKQATWRKNDARRARVPVGALAIVWKDWIALRRAPGGLRGTLVGFALWIACGVGAAVLTSYFDDRTPLGAFESVLGLRIVFWTPLAATNGLAADIAQPLFWLSTDSLRARLAAWTVSRSWQASASLGCGAAAAAFASGKPVLALGCIPFAAISVYAFKALGIGMYAVFPNPLDAGGPMLLLRLVASIAYLIPGAAVFAVAAILHAGPVGAMLACALVLGLQAWIVIELVARRFTEYGAALATIARTT